MRTTLGARRTDRLFFAQVREDPMLEIETLVAGRERVRVAVVGSGGCTALSLLAAGAAEVLCVDLNAAQNHLIELKLAAVSMLAAKDAIAFLGSGPSTFDKRLATYAALRDLLTPAAREYWDGRRQAVAAGVHTSGVTERFLSTIAFALRHLVVGDRHVDQLLACDEPADQLELFHKDWRGWRWHALFATLCNRAVIRRTYDASFFRNASHGSFADHFRGLAEHALTELPLADNYFVHQLLGDGYRPDVIDGVPPYLSRDGAATVSAARDRLTLVDASMTDCLRVQPPESIDAFALSNICEWLDRDAIDALFAEVVRTAAPHARLVFRNFVGWTEVPERWRHVVIEDRSAGDALIRRDRSAVQRRIAVCRIEKEAA